MNSPFMGKISGLSKGKVLFGQDADSELVALGDKD
jgi:hypothetical protein